MKVEYSDPEKKDMIVVTHDNGMVTCIPQGHRDFKKHEEAADAAAKAGSQ